MAASHGYRRPTCCGCSRQSNSGARICSSQLLRGTQDLEFIRTKQGAANCSRLQLVGYQDHERQNEIMQVLLEQSFFVAKPRVYRVEDGTLGQVNPDVVATKMCFDATELLNPSKLRGCEQRHQIMADPGGRQRVVGDAAAVLSAPTSGSPVADTDFRATLTPR